MCHTKYHLPCSMMCAHASFFVFVFTPHAVIEFSWYSSTSYQVLFYEYETHQMDTPEVTPGMSLNYYQTLYRSQTGTQKHYYIRSTKLPIRRRACSCCSSYGGGMIRRFCDFTWNRIRCHRKIRSDDATIHYCCTSYSVYCCKA